MKNLRVALIQQKFSENRDETLNNSCKNIRIAASNGARLVALQELHTGPYFCQTEDVEKFDLAETIPGPTTGILGALSLELGIVIVASLFEKRAPGLYHNTAVVLDSDGSIAGTYRKMHIPDDPSYYEKFYFTPGDKGFTPIDTSLGRLGVLVCWDQWYPEAARLMALAGAELLIYPTAIGWDPKDNKDEKERQLSAWETIQRGHAIANGIPLLSINRTGLEKSPDHSSNGIEFWGNSFIAGPQGEILVRASNDMEETLIYDIDMERSEKVRRIWPFFRDRRIDEYEEIIKRFRD